MACRGGEASRCLVTFFQQELDNSGIATSRLIYNPVFTKTCQGGSKKLAKNKYLIANKAKPEICPLRLYNKLIEKRGIATSDRLFLTPNRYWNNTPTSKWYKNSPIGHNEISKWTKTAAREIGLDTANRKITNHSSRATAVSHLSKAGIQHQELIKITGHGSTSSIEPYLQMDETHHQSVINKMRQSSSSVVHVLKKDKLIENWYYLLKLYFVPCYLLILK